MEPTIISYRSKAGQNSQFLNVEELLKTDDYKKIKKIYDDIYSFVTAYAPHHVDSLCRVENKLHERIIELEEKKIKELKRQNKGWKGLSISFLTLGVGPLIFLIKQSLMANQIKEIGKTHKSFSRALKQMKDRTLEKELHTHSMELWIWL